MIKIAFILKQSVLNVSAVLFLSFVLLLSLPALEKAKVFAQERSYVYESIDVNIDQNQDSTMIVTEEMTYRFNGTYFAVSREISLDEENKVRACKDNPNLLCGGFEFLQILEVRDDQGNILTPASEDEIVYDSQNRATVSPDKYIVTTTFEGLDKRFHIQWLFAQEGRNFNNEQLKFTIKYVVFGAPGFFDDFDLLYWNAVFGDREALVENVNVTINYPGQVDTSTQSLQIPGHGGNYQIDTINEGKTVNIRKQNLLPYESFTVLQKLPKGMIDKYVTLNLDLSPSSQDININDTISLSSIKDRLAGLPSGKTKLEFSAEDRVSKVLELEFEPGEERDLEVTLELTREEYIKLVAIIVINVLGISILPIGLIIIYRFWKSKGTDHTQKSVIVPEYRPPDDIHPYILGSLKDEQVDMVDITASIIDLAYRGYIKIVEFEAKQVMGIKISKADFELLKLKEYSDLTEPEKELMDSIFGNKDRITTKDLQQSFYKKYPAIRTKIYEEMVNRKYFNESPDKVRIKYIGVALAVIALAIFLALANGFLPIFIGATISVGMMGIVMFFIAKHMPAKTETGSKVFHKVLGFKMYMETAEKYRVQNLTPETFEKFLSYAIVFGIEKQWADKFKDIYKGKPDWYEGSSDTFSTIYLANAMANFSTTTATAMTASVNSSGGTISATGGGWSGGGGFSGGFSGGGGGGGGGGAW